MRRFMLLTLALATLASQAMAQERICYQPEWDASKAETLAILDAPINQMHSLAIRLRTNEVFDRSFKEHCKAGDVISLPPRFQSFVQTHCDLNRPVNRVNNDVICFAQLPPRQY
jgi:hypothetical protein